MLSVDTASEFGMETQRQSVVMIQKDGTIGAEGAVSEKPTVYVPYVYNTGFSVDWRDITVGTPTWTPGMDLDVLSQYFNIVTDTVGDPTGEADADGNPTYTKDDLTRASAEEIVACDYVLVGMTGAYTTSYDSNFVKATEYLTGWEEGTRQNRSYKDNIAPAAVHYGDLEAQLEDVPRDMECYVDANGNTYDFAFDLNWSGVINEARMAKYSAEPITKCQNFDYIAYDAFYQESSF